MHVALIAHNHFPIREPFAGGIEAHVWHLTRALIEDGHAVTLFAAADSDLDTDHPALTVRALPRTAAASVAFPWPGAVKESHHRAFAGLMGELADPGSGFDVVHNHSLNYVPLLAAPRLRIPMVTTLHTPPFPMLEAAVGAVARSEVQFAAVSRQSAAAWDHVGIERMAVVPNGVDMSRWPLGPGGDDLVWSGRIVPEKGTHLAVDAAMRSGRRLVLAGPIGDADYFQRSIEPWLGDGVEYAGHLGQRDLAALVGGAAATLVTPVWDEPYGQVVVESMACGTPVVAFAGGGIPELVDERGGCLVPSGDVGALAAAVPDAVQLSRALVRETAAARHGLTRMVADYVGLYRRLVAESAARRAA
ncbi:glycosyltransferase [Mycolicibacterium iranicum]|uniref:Glycosyl transferase family 1 n=1 Tax=Mycolicibacterium iranicum TaxID=912594 RepID=A0A178LR13_MYCIR|nr:glycosyl transferase family 1 [Mycolicibacterium iranicum]